MAEKKARDEVSILQIVLWQEVLEERRYSRQMSLITNERVGTVLEMLRKTEERHKKETLASLRKLKPGFAVNYGEFSGGKISGVLLLDEKEFYSDRDRLDLNSAEDVRTLLSIIDTNIKRESFIARLYDSLTMDAKDEMTKKMLGRFVSDEQVHLKELKKLGERIKLMNASLLAGAMGAQ